MKVNNFGLALLAIIAIAVSAPSAKAAVIAYEGFDEPTLYGGFSNAVNNAPLAGVDATGWGFAGSWLPSNDFNNVGESRYRTAGLAYPASYQGTNVAVGGHAQARGVDNNGQNAFHRLNLDTVADAWVNSAPEIHISWLAEIVSAPNPLDDATRALFDLPAEYPRNAGIRLMSGPLNTNPKNNGALGMIGNSGDWRGDTGGAPAQSAYGDAELGPEVVDTWGAFGWNDYNNRFTGNGGTQAAPGSAFYNPKPGVAGGVDHLVLSIDTATSTYHLQVNPQINGTNDGELTWVHTDGAVVPFVMHGFGVEAGKGTDRPRGDMVFDEIIIATSFEDAAGFVQVPEPSSFVALLSLIGLGAGAMRRR